MWKGPYTEAQAMDKLFFFDSLECPTLHYLTGFTANWYLEAWSVNKVIKHQF